MVKISGKNSRFKGICKKTGNPCGERFVAHNMKKRVKELEGRIKRILDVTGNDQCPATKLGEVVSGETHHICCTLDIGHGGKHNYVE